MMCFPLSCNKVRKKKTCLASPALCKHARASANQTQWLCPIVRTMLFIQMLHDLKEALDPVGIIFGPLFAQTKVMLKTLNLMLSKHHLHLRSAFSRHLPSHIHLKPPFPNHQMQRRTAQSEVEKPLLKSIFGHSRTVQLHVVRYATVHTVYTEEMMKTTLLDMASRIFRNLQSSNVACNNQ